jgi:hypothetical protein
MSGFSASNPEIPCTAPRGCSDPWPTGARVCRRSCYHKYSTELSARWDAEAAERESRGKYKGCPVCKQKVLFSCYHDGVDYSSVELDLPEPERRVTIEMTESELETLKIEFFPRMTTASLVAGNAKLARAIYALDPKLLPWTVRESIRKNDESP